MSTERVAHWNFIDGMTAATPQHAPSDAELARRIRSGDEGALASVFREHYAALASFTLRFVDSRDVSEELVQDLFLSLWARRDQLTDVESFRTYLFRAMRNRALNHLRRKRLERKWEQENYLPSEPSTPGRTDDETTGKEVAVALERAIAKLPPRCREVFLLSREGGMTYAEIGVSLGISVKTVETQMGRALKSLRQALEPFRV